MSMTFIHRNTDSDLTGGTVNYSLLKDTATGAEVTVNLAASASVTYSAFTASEVPSEGGATGNYTINLRILTGNTNAYCKVQLHRVNSSGTIQNSSSESSEEKLNNDASWSYTNLNLGTWAAGDRLRVDFIYRNDASNKSISFGFGVNTSDDSVVTPFVEVLEDLDVQIDLTNAGQTFEANVKEVTNDAQADLVNTGQVFESEVEVFISAQADLVNEAQEIESEVEVFVGLEGELVNAEQTLEGMISFPVWKAKYSPTGAIKYKDGESWVRGTIYKLN